MKQGVPLEPGFTSGKLTVIEDTGSASVLCRCECGSARKYLRSNIRGRLSKSCGCVGRLKTIARNKCTATHHASRTRLYTIYWQMYKRCHVPTNKDYRRYGARGITVCDEWRNSPAAFIEWARSHGYRDDLTIDRIAGGTSGYSPENCRWATVSQQANNRRTNVRLTFNGKQYTLAEFARFMGVKPHVVKCRHRKGWTAEEIYYTPAGAGRKGRINHG